MPRFAIPFLVLMPLLATLPTRGAAQAEGDAVRSTMSGVYSAAQATRGEETYMSICVACHPAATYATPAFRTAWSGRLVSDLFDVVKEKMPKNDPGSLTPAEAAQVLAYLLKINDIPAGETDLPEELAALKRIRFETPSIREGKAGR